MGRKEDVIKGIKRFKEKIGVEEVILFSSYARREVAEHSDVTRFL